MDAFGELLATVRKDYDVTHLLDRMQGGVSGQESGGNTQAVNSRTRATGEFQVIPANIPSWSQKYYGKSLTPEQFKADPKAQEVVFRGEMGKYLKRAMQKAGGDEDLATRMAAAAWYGGEGAMHRYDDPTKFRPNEPSFKEYTSKVLARTKGQSSNEFASLLKSIQPTEFDGLLDSIRTDAPDAQDEPTALPTPADIKATGGNFPAPTEADIAELERLGQKIKANEIDPATQRRIAVNEFLGAPAYHLGGNESGRERQLGDTTPSPVPGKRGSVASSVPVLTGTPSVSEPQVDEPQIISEQEWQPFKRVVSFQGKPAGMSNQDYLVQELAPEIAAKYGLDTLDVEKQIKNKITHISGPTIENATAYDYTFTAEDLAVVDEMAQKRDAVLRNAIASGQPISENVKNQLSQDYGIDPRQFENPGDDYYQAAEKGKANREKYEAQLKRYRESLSPDDANITAEIRAKRDMGWISDAQAEELITQTNADYKKLRDEVRQEVETARNVQEYAGDTGTFNMFKTNKERELAMEADIRERLNEKLKEYGGDPTAYIEDQQQMREKYKNRPFALPAEAVRKLGRYVASIPATLLDAAAIAKEYSTPQLAYDYLSGTEGKASESYLGQAAAELRKQIENDPVLKQNKDFKDWFLVNELPEAIAQLATQAILAPLTGGASLALPIAEAATSQYREADKAGASKTHRLLATIAGGALAVPDALLNAKYLRGLTTGQKTNLLTNIADKIFGKLVPEVGEGEARIVTKSFLENAIKKGAFGFGAEYIQETGEDIGNEIVAKLTYKPETTFGDIAEKVRKGQKGYLAAGIAGGLGGTVEAASQGIAPTETKAKELPFSPVEAPTAVSEDVSPVSTAKTQPRATESKTTGQLERVSTPKGEGVVVEDRGTRVLIDFDNGSRSEVRKNQVTPATDLPANKDVEQTQEVAPVETAKVALPLNKISDEPAPVKTEIPPEQKAEVAPVRDTQKSVIPLKPQEESGKRSKVGIDIEAKTIAADLSTAFEGTAEYTPVTIKEQAERATNLVNTDLAQAREIINGDKTLPPGLRAAPLISAVENYARKNNDVELLKELASSPLVSDTSLHAQEMRLLRERHPYSPVKLIQEVQDSRKTKRTQKYVAKEVENIQKEKRSVRPREWSEFLESIKCS